MSTSTATPQPQKSPVSATTPNREAAEPLEHLPLKPGECDWCSGKTKRRRDRYCSNACRAAFKNWAKARGARVIPLLLSWRKHRGAKNTPGAGKIGTIAQLADEFLAERRNRAKN